MRLRSMSQPGRRALRCHYGSGRELCKKHRPYFVLVRTGISHEGQSIQLYHQFYHLYRNTCPDYTVLSSIGYFELWYTLLNISVSSFGPLSGQTKIFRCMPRRDGLFGLDYPINGVDELLLFQREQVSIM